LFVFVEVLHTAFLSKGEAEAIESLCSIGLSLRRWLMFRAWRALRTLVQARYVSSSSAFRNLAVGVEDQAQDAGRIVGAAHPNNFGLNCDVRREQAAGRFYGVVKIAVDVPRFRFSAGRCDHHHSVKFT